MKCNNCKHNRTCTRVWRNSKKECPYFVQTTNADHIRSMTDEELAEFIVHTFVAVSDDQIEAIAAKGHFMIWLKQPYKE